MTYAALAQFGHASFGLGFRGIEPWGRHYAETDEVYLWRATFKGAPIKSIEDMQAIAASIGRQSSLGLDLRGIAVNKTGDKVYTVDAAFTAKQPTFYTPFEETAQDIANKVATELATRMRGLSVTDARFEQITDDAPKHPALDFWLSRPIIWDVPYSPIAEFTKGKPTAAFARFEGLYSGRAEQGLNLKAWPRKGAPSRWTRTDDKKKEETTKALLWVGGGALALLLVWQAAKRGRTMRRA